MKLALGLFGLGLAAAASLRRREDDLVRADIAARQRDLELEPSPREGDPVEVVELGAIVLPTGARGPVVASTAPSVTALPPELRKGDTGEFVKKLQVMLGLAAYGTFGDETKKAVKAFQAKADLPETGIVDQPTWTALFAHEAMRTSAKVPIAKKPVLLAPTASPVTQVDDGNAMAPWKIGVAAVGVLGVGVAIYAAARGAR